MKTGIELIAQERKEQIEKHGWSIDHDKRFNKCGELLWGTLAVLKGGDQDNERLWYERGTEMPPWWDYEIKKTMVEKSYKERLIIAGALIAAEIDRIQQP